MSRGESLLRLFLAGFAALLSFLLVFGLTGLAITYYVAGALARGQAPTFLVVEEVGGRKTARVDIFPAFLVSLAISPILGYAYYKVLTASLSGAPLRKKAMIAGALYLLLALGVVATGLLFCSYTCPKTCLSGEVLLCDYLLQRCLCKP